MAPRLAALSLALLLITVSCTSTGFDTTVDTTAVTVAAPPSTAQEADPGLVVTLTDVSELVKAVEASVATVTQTQLQLDDLQETEVPTGTGTGVVIDTDGHVLTNAHVVAGAQNVILSQETPRTSGSPFRSTT